MFLLYLVLVKKKSSIRSLFEGVGSRKRVLNRAALGFLKDNEFVADEVPGESGDASHGTTNESPLIYGEPTDFVKEVKDQRRCDDIDGETD